MPITPPTALTPTISTTISPTTAPSGRATPARSRRSAALVLGATAFVAALGLAACGSEPKAGAVTTDRPADGQVALTLDGGWAKAGSGMTAVFGTVRNSGSQPVRLVGGTSVAARSVELHTMARQPDGTMRMTEKPGGVVVPAGGAATLAPGGDNIMLLGLTRPLANGDDVRLTMRTDAGATVTWIVPVRSFSGAEESYTPDAAPTSGAGR